MQPRPNKARRSAFAAALLASAVGHGLLAVLVIPRLSTPVARVPEAKPLEIVMIAREDVPALRATPTPASASASAGPSRGTAAAPTAEPAVAPASANAVVVDAPSATPTGTPNETPGGLAIAIGERREEAIREALSPTGQRLVPRNIVGLPGGPRSPTDSIDGIPRLGTGEPGDPRIPGSGNVNIAKVVERDGVVAQAQERARQGNIHPFLGAVKDRVEECWLPVAADADALLSRPSRIAGQVRQFVAMEDPACAAGYHRRHTVGRVFAIYDPHGARLAIELDTGPEGSAAVLLRNIKERVALAFEKAGMREVPPELLDENGLLRVAWNVFIDDYRECNLMGQGANAHKPGGDEIIGIVELDGLY